ncbi:unnamed protein product [Pieris macdunnoughi]|uniref:Uncharacterized protein n=1 Tax=Pieris macdunnoughi TaxID=345717 RepID=A0A821LJ19_9NEOP|nr:unnamed protein product [Pieris macdunnoughi]
MLNGDDDEPIPVCVGTRTHQATFISSRSTFSKTQDRAEEILGESQLTPTLEVDGTDKLEPEPRPLGWRAC